MTTARQNTRRDELAMAAFVRAREAGDEEATIAAWNELLTLRFDQVRGMFYANTHGHLNAGEQDDAFSTVLLELAAKGRLNFRGSTLGEWVQFVKKVIFHRATDFQRKAAGRSKNEIRLELQNTDGDEYLNPDLVRALADTSAADADAHATAEELAAQHEFIRAVLPQLTDKRRLVWELTLEGLPCSMIEERLGMGRDAVHQNRSRGLADLRRIAAERGLR